MFIPGLAARVEEFHPRTGFQVLGCRLVDLPKIARSASESPVPLIIGAALARRNDMLQMVPIPTRTLRGVAILATTMSATLNDEA